jgi:hypothetical protein
MKAPVAAPKVFTPYNPPIMPGAVRTSLVNALERSGKDMPIRNVGQRRLMNKTGVRIREDLARLFRCKYRRS